MTGTFSGSLPADIIDHLYKTKEELWGYFIQDSHFEITFLDAPCYLTQNTKTTLKLTNGTRAQMHSLTLVMTLNLKTMNSSIYKNPIKHENLLISHVLLP